MDAPGYDGILADVIATLDEARSAAARSVNTVMTATYWRIGHRIVEYEQSGDERAPYGQALLEQLAVDLTRRFGRGFGVRNLYQMRQFRLVWTPEKILQTVSAESGPHALEPVPGHLAAALAPTAGSPLIDPATVAKMFALPWSAYVRLLSVANPLARDFYEIEALRNGWTVRQLNRQINSQFYERTALSRDKAAMLTKAAEFVDDDRVRPPQSAARRSGGESRATENRWLGRTSRASIGPHALFSAGANLRPEETTMRAASTFRTPSRPTVELRLAVVESWDRRAC